MHEDGTVKGKTGVVDDEIGLVLSDPIEQLRAVFGKVENHGLGIVPLRYEMEAFFIAAGEKEGNLLCSEQGSERLSQTTELAPVINARRNTIF